MLSLEQELKNYLYQNKLSFTDNTSSYKKLDFTIKDFIDGKNLHIDAKEKRQKINVKNWPIIASQNERDCFIIDDLSARKTLCYAPYSGLLVRNNLVTTYYWFSILDLFLMPKKRVNRPIKKNHPAYKGKWIINFRNALSANSIEDIFLRIKKELSEIEYSCTQILECYGSYLDETIAIQGETRNPKHWKTDIASTR